MPEKKRFDCLAMKDEIQAKLLLEWQGMTDEEIRAAIRHDLETSDEPIARWWRRIAKHDKAPHAPDSQES